MSDALYNRRKSKHNNGLSDGAGLYTTTSKGDNDMRRTTVNYIVDTVAFLNLVLMIATGIILKWVLPPGSGGGQGHGFRGGRGPDDVKQLLGLGRHDWGDVHFVLSLLFTSLMLIHLILHWSWIKTCTKSILTGSATPACVPDEESTND